MKQYCTYEEIGSDSTGRLISGDTIEVNSDISVDTLLKSRRRAEVLHWGLSVVSTDAGLISETVVFIADVETGKILRMIPEQIILENEQ